MPHLRILGKPSMFAGDDIRWPMVAGMAFRTLQIVASFVLLMKLLLGTSAALKEVLETALPTCLEGSGQENRWALHHVHPLLVGYTASSGVVAVMGFVEFFIMFLLSQMGTPTNPEPRKHLGILCSLNFSVTFGIRIGTFLFGVTVQSIAAVFCNCVYDLYGDGSEDDPDSDAGRMMLGELESTREHCWMFRSTWSLLLLTLFATQMIDVLFGCLYYATRICSFIPRGILFQASTRWELCCRCCFGLLSCCTCFRNGGLETVGSGELHHFASILTDYFESDGILDVAATDILVGLYITKLIHFEEEYTVREQLKDNITQSILNESDTVVTKSGVQNDTCKETDSQSKECKEVDSFNPELDAMVKHTKVQFEKAGIVMDEAESMEEAACRSTYHPRATKPSSRASPRSRASVLMLKPSAPAGGGNPIPHATDISLMSNPMSNNTLSPEKMEEKYLIAEGARYIAFATNIYTWSTKDKEPFCYWNVCGKKNRFKWSDQRGRAMQVAPIYGVSEDDMFYTNYKAGIEATPYAVVLDHAWNSVIVAIRGSQSIDDMMSDLTIDRTELSRVGEKYGFHGIGRFAHKGILGCAEWVTDDLLRVEALDKLLSNDDAEYKNYQLRIVGHSLGAAAASLVALFLRSKFPTVRAVVYEAPGCTMCWTLAEEACNWCISFVTGMDVITRFTIESMADLRDEMLVNIARIKVPKYLVNRNRGIQAHGIDAVREFLAEALYPADDIPESKFLDSVREFRRYYKLKMEKRMNDADSGLYLPGRIIHMVAGFDSVYEETKPNTLFTSDEEAREKVEAEKEKCISYWANREDFRVVILSPHFLSDHGTDEVKFKFDALTQAFGVKEPYADVLRQE